MGALIERKLWAHECPMDGKLEIERGQPCNWCGAREPLVAIHLPFPPSVNNLYFNVQRRGRVETPEYLNWQDEAGWELKSQRPRKIEGRCIVSIDLDETRRGDADNRSKAVLDLLVTHGIIGGDDKKYVRRVSIGWEPIAGCRVVIQEAT